MMVDSYLWGGSSERPVWFIVSLGMLLLFILLILARNYITMVIEIRIAGLVLT